MHAARCCRRHELAVPYVDAGMADMRRARVKEDEVADLEVAAPPDAFVVAMAPQFELHGCGVGKVRAVVQECPSGEARTVESLRSAAAPSIRHSKLFQASALDMETLFPLVAESMRGHRACG